jgi:hypothetical protein
MLRIFVDTSIARFADRKREVWLKQKETIRWGKGLQEVEIARPHTFYPLEKLNNEQDAHTYADALLIEKVEDLARAKLITLCWHFETHWEFIRNKTLGIPAPAILDLIEKANCPIYYGRPLTSPFHDNTDEQLEFLRRLKLSEYEKWKKLVGGAEPNTKRERNQLMDAWHLWSADHNHCEYFLTMDYTLIRSVGSRKNDSKLRVVAPTQFLDEFKHLQPAAEVELAAWKKINEELPKP